MSNTTTHSYGELVLRRADQLRMRGNAGNACRDFNKAYNLLKSEGKADTPAMLSCLHMWGVALCSNGKPAEASKKLDDAETLANRLGDMHRAGHIARDRAKADMMLADLGGAEAQLEKSLALLAEFGGTEAELGSTIGFQGRLAEARGHYVLAVELMSEADKLLSDDPPAKLYNKLRLARAAHQAGLAVAAGHARTALSMSWKHGGWHHRSRAVLLMFPITWRLETSMRT